jgi:para-aminobenzoate synthetase/4-amino-4-deoxychorismate lyase
LKVGFDPALPFALLEDSRAAAGDDASLLFSDADGGVVATRGEEVLPGLVAVDEARKRGLFPCGYVAYEAGYSLVEGHGFAQAPLASPLLAFRFFTRRERLNRGAVGALLDTLSGGAPCAVHDLELSRDRDAYAGAFARVLDYIRAGDVYQVNYTLKARFGFAGGAAALYRELRRHQAVEYGALLSFPDATVLSLSPELFVRKHGASLIAKPMKGTARRGATPAEDEAIVAALRADPKTLAENLMIVDLIRSDLGRLAAPGTVVARDLFEIQTFETVHQMVSTVEGRVDRDLPVGDALRRLLPCGSITGAPKVRAMEIIQELEVEPRGVYCGAIGHVAPGGDFAFNVPIRTVVVGGDGRGEMGIGSGIVADARMEAELEECVLKARFLGRVNAAFQLIETVRWEAGAGEPARFAAHLARMEGSARVFGFGFDRAAIREAIRSAGAGAGASARAGAGALRVRALLFHDGRVVVTTAPIGASAGGVRRVVWSETAIDSGSIFQRHKTTVRGHYDRAYEEASAGGAYDVLFLNERGELAEASRHNVFVERGGRLFTPPLTSGALPGVGRAAVLVDPAMRASEAVLRLEDVVEADRVLLCNAVRGLVAVAVEPQTMRATSLSRR